jgi:hypothetical protein
VEINPVVIQTILSIISMSRIPSLHGNDLVVLAVHDQARNIDLLEFSVKSDSKPRSTLVLSLLRRSIDRVSMDIVPKKSQNTREQPLVSSVKVC